MRDTTLGTAVTFRQYTGAHKFSSYRNLPYDPVRDFTPISLVAYMPFALLIHPSVPAKNVKELIALAKAQPGKLNYASAGTGGPTHLVPELFKTIFARRVPEIPDPRKEHFMNSGFASWPNGKGMPTISIGHAGLPPSTAHWSTSRIAITRTIA